MNTQSVRRVWTSLAVVSGLLLGLAGTALADSASSPHYQVNETQFGAGSGLHDCSDSFCAKTGLGDLTVGSASSDNFSAQFGFNTSDVPVLEIIAGGGITDLGVLDTDTAATASGFIKVRSYLSTGYVIELTGNPPSQGAHQLNALTSPSTSQPGTEQFGVNLAANTNPSVGAGPAQVPNSSFSYGQVEPDYATPNLFKYASGDPVARSSSSTGETDYTISLLINISNVTPGGHYSGSFSAVVVPTY